MKIREKDYRGLADSFEQVEMTRAIGGNDLKAIREVRALIKKYNPNAFTLEDAEDMVEDQIRMDKEAGREPLAYDPQFFYDTIVELMEQDAE